MSVQEDTGGGFVRRAGRRGHCCTGDLSGGSQPCKWGKRGCQNHLSFRGGEGGGHYGCRTGKELGGL